MEIKPTYVTFEQAKILKKIGFKQIEMPSYLLVSYENVNVLKTNPNNLKIGDLIGYYIPKKTVNAPEQWQVVEWLRVNYGIWVSIDMVYEEIQTGFWYCIRQSKVDDIDIYSDEYTTPQEAYSAAFDYVLNNLI